MPRVPTRFADTTAIFEYHVGTSASRADARRLLQPRDEVASSGHVEREWKRIVFTTVRDLLAALEEEEDFSAAVRRMGIGFGREPSQRWLALALLCAGSDRVDASDIRLRALRMLRGDMERLYRQCVGENRTASRCGLARQIPQQDARGRWHMKTTCKRGEGICDHEARITRDLRRWKAGADALTSSTQPALRKMGALANEMADDPGIRTGVNTYGRTGDLAIALDCKVGELIVTTDVSFTVLAPAMGVQVHRIPSSTASGART